MKRLAIHIVYALLISGIAAVATTAHNVPRYLDSGETFTTQRDVDGWVDPEDLVPMPQCIAQQDQSAWLGTMTKCARQRCTSHFAFFCTHHRWLTELSCLSVEFSPDAVENYVPYCSRSILAKAQLYHWIRNVTGRTWLVNVGDATGLQTLSPANLAQGYASTGVVSKAPACLSRSRASPSLESFEHVLASCTFTSTALHTGNAAHPWEYSTSRQSMIALSFDTAGYDLTGKHIPFNEYFDRECFCSAFIIDQRREPCLTADQLDLTKERLWLNATCGPASLPKNWTASLKMMGFKYIPFAGWHWPQHVTDMPKQVTILTERCATEACRLDSDGYCVAAPAVDRACFCSNIDYNSCQASCRFFESRIGFVKWLHELCGHVDGWHGLPTNWRELTTPLPGEMIPWRWFVRPNYSSATSTVLDPRSVAVDQCWSNEWILASIAFVNFATMLAPFFGKRRGYRSLTINPPLLHPLPCMLGATLLASLHLVANWFNARIIQSTPGYETVPVFQLTLLWCSLPRLSWLTIAPAGVHRLRATEFSSSAVSLFAEMILQCFALYHMSLTVNYGRQHNFYFGGLANTKSGRAAMLIDAGNTQAKWAGKQLHTKERYETRQGRLCNSPS
ncbi:hypothetical protein A9K55_006440 [Cordyceps militaris]|uniref:Integral membrane n=1 Tax=Cordyceps militaris TaxID=73501 RepID=A0A2H4SCV8_CORMI|nr:hypothetical protein A9K55_006440 [Cordyceps militaris]